MSEPTNLFWYSSVAVQLLFCVHLLWSGLARKHPIFTLYLGCAVVRSIAAFFFTAGYNGALPLSYTYFWLCSEPVLLLLQIAVALEVHSAMWKEYASALRSARSLVVVLLLAAILFAAIPLGPELRRDGAVQLHLVLHFEFLVKRYVSSVLALFLSFSALTFLVVIRNSFKNEFLRHESMLAAYFGLYAIACLFVNMGWTRAVFVNNYLLSALTVLLVVWMSVFRPGPELARQ